MTSKYHSVIMSIVDVRNEVAIISATTLLGSNKGCLGTFPTTTNGIARGRTDVSCPTTSGGSYLHSRSSQRPMASSRLEVKSHTSSGSREEMGSLPRVSE